VVSNRLCPMRPFAHLAECLSPLSNRCILNVGNMGSYAMKDVSLHIHD